jgi:3-isopropylmalate dehydrogenase
MKATIAVLPGDGIGPEVTSEAIKVLQKVSTQFDHDFAFNEAPMGGNAIDRFGDACPESTIKTCEQADAILLGAVGGPKWSDPAAAVRPEQGLLKVRKHFELFANLRPVKAYKALVEHTPLRAEFLEGVDLLFVRELTGGLYFGPRLEQGDGDTAYDTELYTVAEVERVAHVAFRAAQSRRKKVTSVDKANVMASSRLWRRTVSKVHEDYPDVELDHVLADACTMYLMTRPASFDVLIASNMFGDILSDEASVLGGSLGMSPSASLGSGKFGLYEPIHGSAPDIAGQGKANPTGTILSVAMLLRYSFGLEAEAKVIETAIDMTIEEGACTADIAPRGGSYISTTEFTQAVLGKI